MKTLGLFLLLITSLSITVSGQIAGDLLVGGYVDLVKTDNDGFFGKAQLGVEANYLFSKQFTGSLGVDIWTGSNVSLVIGGRWYPTETFFVRARGLIGENDLSIGAGWNKPLNDKWRVEAIGDFYFAGEFAARAGMVYTIRKK